MLDVRNENGMRWTRFSSQSIIALMDWIGGDGHSVIGVENIDDRKVRELGFTPKEWMIFGYMADTYKSDLTNPKSTITDKHGLPINVIGWATLDIQWSIANAIGADTDEASEKHGRGSQAQCLKKAIDRRLWEIVGMVKNSQTGDVAHGAVVLPIETILGKEVTA